MLHRHLNHQRFTLAAIDDAISRGKWKDWEELRHAALHDREVIARIQRICAHYADDPYRQRHRFWANYAEAHSDDS